MLHSWKGSVLPGLLIALFLVSTPVGAQDEETAKKWSEEAELSWVATSGNSQTSTFGLKSKTLRTWERALFTFKLGALKADTTVTDVYGVGPPPDPAIVEEEFTETTAENYYIDARYERKITDKFYWYVGAGWLRNEFAGIKNRTQVQGGVGNIWFDGDKLKFKSDYAVTYTDQEDLVQIPDADGSFAGLKLTTDLSVKLGKNASYDNDFVFDYDLENTDNWFGNMINALTVSISKSLALKASLQWLYFNDPAYEMIDVYDIPPDEGGVIIGEWPNQLKSLDSIFTTSLVVTF